MNRIAYPIAFASPDTFRGISSMHPLQDRSVPPSVHTLIASLLVLCLSLGLAGPVAAQIPPPPTALTLSGLTIADNGNIEIALPVEFAPDVHSYDVRVANYVKSVTVTPTVTDVAASVTVNTVTVESGTASRAITLAAPSGATVITIVVAAAGETQDYTLSFTAPSIAGPGTVGYQENSADPVGTYTAQGTQGALSWHLVGADADVFAFDSDTGVLTFKAPPNFEDPQDSDTDNIYQVNVAAIETEGAPNNLDAVLEVVVTVSNEDELGSLSFLGSVHIGQTLTANLQDPDGITRVTYQWRTRGDGRFETVGTAMTYTIGTSDRGKQIFLKAFYSDRAGRGRELITGKQGVASETLLHLTAHSLASDGATTAGVTYAKVGDTLTLSFTMSEAVTTIPSVTIAGQTASVSDSGNDYTATYTVVATDVAGMQGVVTYDIGLMNASDNPNNGHNPLPATSDIILDTIAPALAIGTDDGINYQFTVIATEATALGAGAGEAMLDISEITRTAPGGSPVAFAAPSVLLLGLDIPGGGLLCLFGVGTSRGPTLCETDASDTGVTPLVNDEFGLVSGYPAPRHGDTGVTPLVNDEVLTVAAGALTDVAGSPSAEATLTVTGMQPDNLPADDTPPEVDLTFAEGVDYQFTVTATDARGIDTTSTIMLDRFNRISPARTVSRLNPNISSLYSPGAGVVVVCLHGEASTDTCSATSMGIDPDAFALPLSEGETIRVLADTFVDNDGNGNLESDFIVPLSALADTPADLSALVKLLLTSGVTHQFTVTVTAKDDLSSDAEKAQVRIGEITRTLTASGSPVAFAAPSVLLPAADASGGGLVCLFGESSTPGTCETGAGSTGVLPLTEGEFVAVSEAAVHNSDDNPSAATPPARVVITIVSVSAPTLTLAEDTGALATDGITSKGMVNVTLADNFDADGGDTWRQSTNGGVFFTTATGTSFNLPEGVYAADDVQVVQRVSGTDSTPARLAAVTVDKVQPSINLHGAASVIVVAGDATYTELATVTDNVDASVELTIGGDAVDTNTPGTYMITYDATDVAGNIAMQVTRTVVVHASNNAPTISGSASPSYAENGTGPVQTYTANDMEGDTITWSIGGGGDADASADASFFSIDATSGALTFNAPPNFENKQDADNNSQYQVTITATDDGTQNMASTLAVTVTVTDADDEGTVTISGAEQVGQLLTASAVTDEDRGVTGTTWKWQRSGEGSTPVDITGATSQTYPLVADDEGKTIQVIATYSDALGSGKTATSAATVAVVSDSAPAVPTLTLAEDTGALTTDGITSKGMVNVMLADRFDADGGDTWRYSTNGGNFFTPGTGTSVPLTPGVYAVGDVQVVQRVSGTDSAPAHLAAVTVDKVRPSINLHGAASVIVALGNATYTELATVTDNVDASIELTIGGDAVDTNTLGTYTITYAATDVAGNTAEMTRTVTVDDDATLSTLTISDGILSPTFDSAIAIYTVDSVGNAVTSFTVTPTVTVSDATGVSVTVNNMVVSSGQASDALGLDVGENFIYIRVTTEDGATRRSYRVTVTRAPNTAPTVAGPVQPVEFAENATGTVASFTAVATGDRTIASWAVDGTDKDAFTISGTGALTFVTSPNYEVPTDAGTNNIYDITVTATDSTSEVSEPSTVTVTVTNADEQGTVTVTGTAQVGSTLTANTPEDPDGSVSSISWQWQRAPSGGGAYADIASSATTTAYIPVVDDVDNTLQVVATYTDGEGSGKTATSAPTTVVVAADVPNQPPVANAGADQADVMTGATVTLDGSASSDDSMIATHAWEQNSGTDVSLSDAAAENPTFTAPATAGELVFTLTVTDDDDASTTDTVTITVVEPLSTDATLSSVALSAGTLVPLFDSGTDTYAASVANSVTDITVTPTTADTGASVTVSGAVVTSGSASDEIALAVGDTTITIVVTAEDGTTMGPYTVVVTRAAPPNTAPVIETTHQAVMHAEHTLVTTVVATYALTVASSAVSTDAGETIVWSLGGTDGALFAINSATGGLTFKVSPDYESPGDNGADNDYAVTVIATDNGSPPMSGDLAVTVTVTNADEPGTVTVTGTAQVGSTLTAVLTDLDGSLSSESLQWQRAPSSGNYSDITSATTATYIPIAADVNNTLRVVATYTDGEGSGKTATSAPTAMVVSAVAPAAPGIALAADTGTVDNDGITSNAQVDVTLEGGATAWEYSTNSGGGYTTGSGTSFELPEGTYTAGQVQVRQTVGVEQSATASLDAVTVDTTAPTVVSFDDITGATANTQTTTTITFSEAVTGLDATAFGTSTDATVTTVSGGPTNYTVTYMPTMLPFTLTLAANSVMDTAGNTAPAAAASAQGTAAPAPNQLPTANAGGDRTVALSATVTLDGSTSSDPDGAIMTYAWSQTSGSPAVSLSDTAAMSPTFTAPSSAATLVFRLTVTDNSGATATDTVTITVEAAPNQRPIASAGSAQSVAFGASVTLDGNASSDPDGTIRTYAWEQTQTVRQL